MGAYETLVANANETPPGALEDKLKKAEKENRPLRVKLGFDPTAPDLHLGHAVALRKLREFQDAGHKAILIIGDFTAKIGDPTGRNSLRPPLSDEQIKENSKTYIEQLSRVLDMSPDKIEIHYNSEWLKDLSAADMIKLQSEMTLGHMLGRKDFGDRLRESKEIRLHELTYPLLQGYDSVAIDSDVELGGTDQTFNIMTGRDLQRNREQEGQMMLATPLLRGLDGMEKMSKSKGNYIGLTDEPKDMYGKVMSIPDGLIEEYLRLASGFPEEEKTSLIANIPTDPMGVKKQLAFHITETYHNENLARAAAEHFERTVQKREKEHAPLSLQDMEIQPGEKLELIALCLKASEQARIGTSKNQLRRLIEQGGVSVAGEKIQNIHAEIGIPADGELSLKIGSHHFQLTNDPSKKVGIRI